MYKNIEIEIKGVAPIILHNGQTADPLNKFSRAIKEISGKRNKTDADHEKMARLEWEAGLYMDLNGVIVVPSKCIEACLVAASKKNKLGKQFTAGVMCPDVNYPLIYKGSKDIDKLYADGFYLRELVRIGTSKIVRTRPMFTEWSLKFKIAYLDDVVTKDQVMQAVDAAGQLIGLCDYRPKYGRFEID